jgi:hypothetical protein
MKSVQRKFRRKVWRLRLVFKRTRVYLATSGHLGPYVGSPVAKPLVRSAILDTIPSILVSCYVSTASLESLKRRLLWMIVLADRAVLLS